MITSARLGCVVLGLGAVAACNGTKRADTRHKDAAVTRDAATWATWIDELQGADRVFRTDEGYIGEWTPVMAQRPAPRELRVVGPDGKASTADHGWVLYAGRTVADTVIVAEEDAPLSYVVRRLGTTADVPLAPPPGGGPWVFRDAVCGRAPAHCAVVLWSPVPGTKADEGKPERLAVYAVDAAALSVAKPYVVESADVLAGTDHVGGIAAHPSDPLLYVVEPTHEGVAKTFVRALDLRTGEERWRVAIAHLGRVDDDVELIATSDGQRLVVALGQRAWSAFELQQVAVLDARSGIELAVRSAPDGWRHVALAAGDESSRLLALRLRIVRGLGESPTVSFMGLSALDTATGAIVDLYDPAAGAGSDEDREAARWRAPARLLRYADGELVLVPYGSPTRSAIDPYPPDRQRQRGEIVDTLLAD